MLFVLGWEAVWSPGAEASRESVSMPCSWEAKF